MCKYMGVMHAKTVAYHSPSNGRAVVAGRQLFEKFQQLHIDGRGRNWSHSLWRAVHAYHDLPGLSELSPYHILFLASNLNYSPVEEPWQCGKGGQCRDVRSPQHSKETV